MYYIVLYCIILYYTIVLYIFSCKFEFCNATQPASPAFGDEEGDSNLKPNTDDLWDDWGWVTVWWDWDSQFSL